MPHAVDSHGDPYFISSGELNLTLGHIVKLNSGGPRMMVVDFDGTEVTAAWRDDSGMAREMSLPAICVHRVSPL